MSAEVKNEFDSRKVISATNEDLGGVKFELMKSIYFVGLIKVLGVTGSMIAIVNLMIK